MDKIGKYESEIVEALINIVRYAEYKNKAGKFDINNDAEEFYRVLLLLFYGWKLGKNANTEVDPYYVGVDLLFLGEDGNKIAVQVTSENDSEKVHKSIRGFKDKAFKNGYTELYILMFKGKQNFPKADFATTVDGKFDFNKSKHIIDHSDLCAKLKGAEFDFIENIWKYLKKWGCLAYSNLDSSIDDLGIIGEIFEFLFDNTPKKSSVHSLDSDVFAKLIVKVPLNFPEEQQNRLSDMIRNTTDKRLLAQKYLQEYEDELKILDLREWIQTKYCEIRGINNHEEPINDIGFLENLVSAILPTNRKNNSHYQGNAKAIVLHFFEFCFIGKKTQEEANRQKSLFD
jgi:hypothetical protein